MTPAPLVLPVREVDLPALRDLSRHLGALCARPSAGDGAGIRALYQKFDHHLGPAAPARYVPESGPGPVEWTGLEAATRARIALPAMEITHFSWPAGELLPLLAPLCGGRDALRALLFPGLLAFWSDDDIERIAAGEATGQEALDAACLCLEIAPDPGVSRHARLAARAGAATARRTVVDLLLPGDLAID